MTVDPDRLARARKDDRAAIVEILATFYPQVYRIAHALSGRSDVGDGVTRYVLRRAFRAIGAWRDEAAPRRWFLHHTILTLRRADRHPPQRDLDTLIPPQGSDPAYSAFVVALRALQYQQKEAFLLHHGEKLDLRQLAVAMDCSTVAASQHLGAANDALHALCPDNATFNHTVARVAQNYSALAPTKELALARVSRGAGRFLWPRRLSRVLRAMIVLAVLLALSYVGVRWWREFQAFFRDVLSH